ncbi:homoserine dehydrogenase [Halobacteriales archaeon QH_8_64_26]|jgi:homoserine dehydrogenase|nr:MAG: homoserine dehydrogenase [Halobacteriales archaeon QH_8_64_26]
MKLGIIGTGAVGSAVARLAPEYGHSVVALADSNSAAIDSDGLDSERLLARKRDGESLGESDPGEALDGFYDVLIEATPTTLGDAEPGFSHVRRALEGDRHAVLANKGPVAERYGELRALEERSQGQVRFEATVAGAIPALSTIADLGAGNVTAVRGVLNGTANFILSRMAAEGLGYEHVLAEAQDLGVAEADPSFDVQGTDAALKCVILANVLAEGNGDNDADEAAVREPYTLADAAVEGIEHVPPSALELAAEDGRTIRLIGEVSQGSVRVGPRLVPEHGTLAVTGTQNILQLETRHAGRLNISGRGAGGPETATAVLADIGRLGV